MDELRYLVYVSHARTEVPDAELSRLAERAGQFNARHGLTGVLAHAGGCFFQWIEGSPVALELAMGRIRKDPMHTDILVLEEQSTPSRTFNRWAMAAERFDFPGDIDALQRWLDEMSDLPAGPFARFTDLFRRFIADRREG